MSQNQQDYQMKRARRIIMILLSLYALGYIGVLVYLIPNVRTVAIQPWQTVLAFLLFAPGLLTSILAYRRNKRGESESALRLLLSGLLITIVPVPLLIAGQAVVSALLMMLLVTVIASATLPAEALNRVIGNAVVVGILVVLVDGWLPITRINPGGVQAAGLYTLALLVLLLFGFALWRYRSFQLRTKLLLLFAVVPAVLVLVVGAVFLSNLTRQLSAQIASASQRDIEAQAADIESLLENAAGDVAFLSESVALNNYISANISGEATGVQRARQTLSSELLSFARANPIYDQIRYLDDTGQEIVRVNTTVDGRSIIVPVENLQNNANRYYFQETMRLRPGELFVSPLDLRVEDGEIELPYTPVIRYATPVEFRGDTTGMVIVNVLAAHFLQPLAAAGSDMILVDEAGNYLFHPNEAKQWGQYLKTGESLLNDLPAIAARLISGETGVWETGSSYLAYTPVSSSGQESDSWYLISDTALELALAPLNASVDLGLAVMAVGLLLTPLLGLYFSQLIARPIVDMSRSAARAADGDLDVHLTVEGADEISVLAQNFNSMTGRLRTLIAGLEARVNERTRDLALAAEVGRNLTQMQDLDRLLTDAVETIRRRFVLYHAQIYLTTASGRDLILRSGTGAAGVELLARGHRLPVGPGSINGVAAAQKRAVVVPDTRRSAIFRPNPLLPDTHAEMSVPLLFGDEVVGVLNLQNDTVNTLTENNLTGFETIAGQLAVAIQNATLFTELAEARQEMEMQVRQLTREGWNTFLDAINREEQIQYSFSDGRVAAAGPTPDFSPTITLPITVTGEAIGTLELALPAESGWSNQDQALVTVVAEQIGQQIENIRLLAETNQYRAEAEKAVRRLAGEGWLVAEAELSVAGFEYDQKRVRPLADKEELQKPYDLAPYLAPLEVQGELIGMVEIDEFGVSAAEGERMVAAIIKQLAGHLENLRLNQQTAKALTESQQRSAELALLNRIVSRVASSLDLREAMQIVVDELVVALDVDQVRVALLDDSKKHLTIIAEHFVPAVTNTAIGVRLPLEGNVLTQMVLNTRQTVVVADVQNNPQTAPAHRLFRDQGIETILILPMAVGRDVIGTVGIDILHKERQLTSEQLRLAETIIFQAATAVQNARLFAQTQAALAESERRALELQIVAEISTAVTTTLQLDDLLQNVVDLTKDRFNLYHAHIYLLDPADGLLKLAAGAGEVGRMMVTEGVMIPLTQEKSLVARVARTREALIVNDVRAETNFLPQPHLPETRAELAVPMIVGENVIGVLDVQARRSGWFSAQDANIQATLAAQVAIAIQNARQYAATQRRATREQLVNEISQKIRSSLTVESALQTAVVSLGQHLEAETVSVKLQPKDVQKTTTGLLATLQEQKQPAPAAIESPVEGETAADEENGQGANGHPGHEHNSQLP